MRKMRGVVFGTQEGVNSFQLISAFFCFFWVQGGGCLEIDVLRLLGLFMGGCVFRGFCYMGIIQLFFLGVRSLCVVGFLLLLLFLLVFFVFFTFKEEQIFFFGGFSCSFFTGMERVGCLCWGVQRVEVFFFQRWGFRVDLIFSLSQEVSFQLLFIYNTFMEYLSYVSIVSGSGMLR